MESGGGREVFGSYATKAPVHAVAAAPSGAPSPAPAAETKSAPAAAPAAGDCRLGRALKTLLGSIYTIHKNRKYKQTFSKQY